MIHVQIKHTITLKSKWQIILIFAPFVSNYFCFYLLSLPVDSTGPWELRKWVGLLVCWPCTVFWAQTGVPERIQSRPASRKAPGQHRQSGPWQASNPEETENKVAHFWCILLFTLVELNLIVATLLKGVSKCRVRKGTIQSPLSNRQEIRSSSSDHSSSHNPNKRTDPAAHPDLRYHS